MDQKKKPQKTYTLPVFVWGVEKHSQRGLLNYYCCKKKDTKNNVQNQTDDLSLLKKKKKKGFLLMLWFCFAPRVDPWSAGFILKQNFFLSLSATTSWSWSSDGAECYSEIPTFLHSRRVIDQCAWLLPRALRRCSPWRGTQRRTCTPARL